VVNSQGNDCANIVQALSVDLEDSESWTEVTYKRKHKAKTVKSASNSRALSSGDEFQSDPRVGARKFQDQHHHLSGFQLWLSARLSRWKRWAHLSCVAAKSWLMCRAAFLPLLYLAWFVNRIARVEGVVQGL